MCFAENTICADKTIAIKTVNVVDSIAGSSGHKLYTTELNGFVIQVEDFCTGILAEPTNGTFADINTAPDSIINNHNNVREIEGCALILFREEGIILLQTASISNLTKSRFFRLSIV